MIHSLPDGDEKVIPLFTREIFEERILSRCPKEGLKAGPLNILMAEEYDTILGHYDYDQGRSAEGERRELPQSAAYLNENILEFSTRAERLRTYITKDLSKHMSWQDFVSLPRGMVTLLIKLVDEKVIANNKLAASTVSDLEKQAKQK